MLFWQIGLDMPQLAHVALPRGSSICIMFCALATHPVSVAALPLARCKRCALFSFCASWTHAFFAIFYEQCLPVDGIAAEVSQKVVPAQTDSFLEWCGVEGAEDQQLPTALDAGDCDVNREWVAHWADAKVGHHAFFDGLPLRDMRCELGREWKLRARHTELGALALPVQVPHASARCDRVHVAIWHTWYLPRCCGFKFHIHHRRQFVAHNSFRRRRLIGNLGPTHDVAFENNIPWTATEIPDINYLYIYIYIMSSHVYHSTSVLGAPGRTSKEAHHWDKMAVGPLAPNQGEEWARGRHQAPLLEWIWGRRQGA